MKANLHLTSRATLLVAAVLIISVASSRLQADTGTCGGQSTTLPFTDVSASIFFCSIAGAYFSGLANGTSATTYNPMGLVSREQMAAFVSRTLDQSLRRGSRRAALNQWWMPALDNSFGETTVGVAPEGVASDGTDLWVANNGGTVSRVRASDGRLLGTWTGATGASDVLVARGRVFVTGQTFPGSLYMIDPTQPPGPVTLLTSLLGDFTVAIAFDGRQIWTANFLDNSVSIYQLSGFLTTVPGFNGPIGFVYDGSNIWVVNRGDGAIKKLDSNGNILQSVPLGSGPAVPVFDGYNIWVPNSFSDSITVVRVKDALGNPLVTPFVLATLTGNGMDGPIAAAFDGERILVANNESASVSLWKAADLTPRGFFETTIGTRPYGACSDGVNFWVTLNTANILKRF